MSKRTQSQRKKRSTLYSYDQDDSYEYKPRTKKKKESSQSEEAASSSQNKAAENQRQGSQESQIKVPMKRKQMKIHQKSEQQSKVQEKKNVEVIPQQKTKRRRENTLYLKLLKQIDLTKQDVEKLNKQRERNQKQLLSKMQQKQEKKRRKDTKLYKQYSNDQNYKVKEEQMDTRKEEQIETQKEGQMETLKQENEPQKNIPLNLNTQNQDSKLRFQEMKNYKLFGDKISELENVIKKQQKQIQDLKDFKKQIKKSMCASLEQPIQRLQKASCVIDEKKPISEKRIQRIERKLQSIQQLSFWSGCVRTHWSAMKKSSDDICIGQGRTIQRKGNKHPGLQFCLKKEPLLSNERTGFSVKIKKFKRSSFLGLLVGVKFVDISEIQQNMRTQTIRFREIGDEQDSKVQEGTKIQKISKKIDKEDVNQVLKFEQSQSQQAEMQKIGPKQNNAKPKSKETAKISDRMMINYVDDENHEGEPFIKAQISEIEDQAKLKSKDNENIQKKQAVRQNNPNLKGIIAYNVIGEIAYNGETLEATKACRQDDIINVIIDKGKYITWYQSYNEIGSVKVPLNLINQNNVMMAFIGLYNKGDTVRLSSMIQ